MSGAISPCRALVWSCAGDNLRRNARWIQVGRQACTLRLQAPLEVGAPIRVSLEIEGREVRMIGVVTGVRPLRESGFETSVRIDGTNARRRAPTSSSRSPDPRHRSGQTSRVDLRTASPRLRRGVNVVPARPRRNLSGNPHARSGRRR
jgi:hypothetical protein